MALTQALSRLIPGKVIVKRIPKTSGSSTPLRDYPLRDGPSGSPSIVVPSTYFQVLA
jgi:hypothetical protein